MRASDFSDVEALRDRDRGASQRRARQGAHGDGAHQGAAGRRGAEADREGGRSSRRRPRRCSRPGEIFVGAQGARAWRSRCSNGLIEREARRLRRAAVAGQDRRRRGQPRRGEEAAGAGQGVRSGQRRALRHPGEGVAEERRAGDGDAGAGEGGGAGGDGRVAPKALVELLRQGSSAGPTWCARRGCRSSSIPTTSTCTRRWRRRCSRRGGRRGARRDRAGARVRADRGADGAAEEAARHATERAPGAYAGAATKAVAPPPPSPR